MFKCIKKNKNQNKDEGHVIFIDKLTDHHIQKEKNTSKKSYGSRIISKTNNK